MQQLLLRCYRAPVSVKTPAAHDQFHPEKRADVTCITSISFQNDWKEWSALPLLYLSVHVESPRHLKFGIYACNIFEIRLLPRPLAPCRRFQPGHATPMVKAHNVASYSTFKFPCHDHSRFEPERLLTRLFTERRNTITIKARKLVKFLEFNAVCISSHCPQKPYEKLSYIVSNAVRNNISLDLSGTWFVGQHFSL